MVSVVYSPAYYCILGAHVFPSHKYRLVYQMLEEYGALSKPNIRLLQPRVPSREELLLVHSEKYLDDILNVRLTPQTFSSELPIKKDTVDAFLLSTGGTLVASESALDTKRSINIGGGYHHAFPDHAEGFCLFNDVAIACRRLLARKPELRIAIVDCDLHQGNGTAYIFRKEKNVFTFSIHQENNYPVKQESDLDIGLDDGVGDDEYLKKLQEALDYIAQEFQPKYVFYLAGADPFEDDQLGALRVTTAGFRKRDDLVIDFCTQRTISLCVVLAGGYARDVRDTVRIHYNTCLRLFNEEK